MEKDNHSWRENWQREIEGAYLYKKLAKYAHDDETSQTLAQMAEQEQNHAAVWEEFIRESDKDAQTPRPDLRIHMIEWVARVLGSESVLGLMVNDEVSDISTYADQSTKLGHEDTYQKVLKDETSHARALESLRKGKKVTKEEPWHRGAKAGGLLRNLVYGFNDGLTANFGLVMGVVGAHTSNQVILLAGFAGLLSDALSMAASGFLAARSEQEVREHHLALERAELKLMPQEEQEELVRFYTQKGLTREEAKNVASRLMEKEDVALNQLARDELGIDPEAPTNPLQEGIVTGIATGLGAVIPILPFLLIGGAAAIWTGIIISMTAHFLVGASRAIFTGRPALRSGFDMFVVGMGVALVTYLLGQIFGVRL
jgi:predicted membrane protein (TIGR00267 family)